MPPAVFLGLEIAKHFSTRYSYALSCDRSVWTSEAKPASHHFKATSLPLLSNARVRPEGVRPQPNSEICIVCASLVLRLYYESCNPRIRHALGTINRLDPRCSTPIKFEASLGAGVSFRITGCRASQA